MAKAIAAAKMSRSLAIGGSGAVRATVSKAPPSWAAAAAAPTYAVTFIVEAAPYQQSRVPYIVRCGHAINTRRKTSSRHLNRRENGVRTRSGGLSAVALRAERGRQSHQD